MKRSALVTAVALFLLSPVANAQGADAGAAVVSPEALEAEIDRDVTALETNDCKVACQALDSMRRATERLCAIDPAARCKSARTKLERAEQRVREACPDCASKPNAPIVSKPPAPVIEEPKRDEYAPPPEPAPPPESKRGGCAGCATTDRSSDAAAAVAFGGLLIAIAMRRRIKR